MPRDWHCPADCMGLEPHMVCPDDLFPDEVCPNGIPDDAEYTADVKFKDEEELPMVLANKHRQQRTPATVKPLPKTFVALDLETTGFDREKDKIIEIGAVRFTDGEPVAIFNTLVKQDVILSAEVTASTGHTTEDIQKGMEEAHAIVILHQFIAGSLIVGHNVLFDYEFYTRASLSDESIYDISDLGWHDDLIDTLTISRERSQYPHKLPDMCKKYNVPQDGWHSAYFDALACGDLLLAMHKEDANYPEGKQVMDYLNVIGWKRQYGEPLWKPDWVSLKPQGSTHVQEGPNVRTAGKNNRSFVVPKVDKEPAYMPIDGNHHTKGKWFGEECPHQICQFERFGGEEDKSQPVLVFCNHTENGHDHEGNCYLLCCPLCTEEMRNIKITVNNLSDDIPF